MFSNLISAVLGAAGGGVAVLVILVLSPKKIERFLAKHAKTVADIEALEAKLKALKAKL